MYYTFVDKPMYYVQFSDFLMLWHLPYKDGPVVVVMIMFYIGHPHFDLQFKLFKGTFLYEFYGRFIA
jgi:hypothetical protein